MNVATRTLLVLALCTVPWAVTDAFWSASLAKTHQDITAESLSMSFTFSALDSVSEAPANFSLPFSVKNAIPAIKTANGNMDQTSVVNYDPIDHFDSEELTRAFRRLGSNRGLLLNELQKQKPDQAEVWRSLGQMLHQIQDFYSHSSWVAAGHADIVHFGALTQNYSAAAAPPPPFNQGAISYPDSPIPGTYCDASATALVVPVPAQITTGYYNPRTPPPVGHCAHGSWPHLFANCVVLVLSPDGINHDSSCFSSNVDVATFQLAKSLATDETTEFVQAIVTDLSNAKNTNGICVLLGLEPASNPCQIPGLALIPSSTTVSLTVTDYGDGQGTLISGPGKVDKSCASPCGFSATGGSFSAIAAITDTWTQYPAPTGMATWSSSLTGDVTFTLGSNPIFTAAATWTDAAGVFEGAFSGSSNFVTSQAYLVSLTPTCTYSYSLSDICNGPLPAVSISTIGGALIQPQSPNSYTLAAGSYVLSWGLFGGTGGSCCIGAPYDGSGPTATITTSVGASFQPIVTVGPAVTLTANPASVTSGNSSTLTWNSPNATSCSAPWTTSTSTSGTASTGPLTADTTYSMTCTDVNGVASPLVSLTVPVTRVLTATITYQGTTIGGSGSVQLGSGSFVYDTTSNTLSAFTLAITNQSSANPNAFNYSLADVVAFSFNQVTGALHLTTQPVNGTNSIYYPQLFTVTTIYGSNVGNTATQDFPGVPQTSGPVTVSVTN